MFSHHQAEPRWRRLRSVGRIGFALAGGGLFALLAWEPPPKNDGTREDARWEGPSARPERQARADGGPVLRDDAAALHRDDRALRSPDPWGAATLGTGKRIESDRDLSTASQPEASTAVRTWFTATADGGLRSTPIRDSRGPP